MIIDIRTMSPQAIAEAKEFAEKENLHGVVRWIDGFFDAFLGGLWMVGSCWLARDINLLTLIENQVYYL